ncbi:tRNA (adenosine(37)-N6)-dimethylallyltransferase MiaA [Falsiroseomonas selenitidurans]|uniref:tRNA dimethylallyltransferase n=1 Tax=Falsiroseomonas selenitidurans TaxID=2716335 RepID=A0ABX1E7X0_9PROT|nr:tRNA (adenosine(37)-N6)-dimethylallyltransferase MiaA [Falsiroseomonas selenitidurans]NKC33063.1 tRNA (adenosine(37)-N6)-dimethylallyltransferase MiaA [Falsiroseomonas selenitidurans]
MRAAQPPAILVAGPTASGKSALALALAERLGGAVINADSMQVYAGLRVLTARPTPEEEARVPHLLYGLRPPAAAGTVAWWRGAALAAMEAVRAAGRVPILCGGTGLYFLSLTQGLSAIPPVPEAARAEARRLLAEEGPAALHRRLAVLDPETAASLRPSDSQRIARAWEVVSGTGRGLRAWQAEAGTGPAPWRFAALLLDPPRDALRSAIVTRWHAMLAAGALEEVRALAAQRLDPALPAMRAHGVPELLAHLQGRMTLEAASTRAILNTGQYTKRQATWFRHHALAPEGAPHSLSHSFHARADGLSQLSESVLVDLMMFIHQGVDAAQHGV